MTALVPRPSAELSTDRHDPRPARQLLAAAHSIAADRLSAEAA